MKLSISFYSELLANTAGEHWIQRITFAAETNMRRAVTAG